MSKKAELQKVYIDALSALDFEPKIDDEGDIYFKIQKMGTAYIVLDAEKDPEFMRLVFPSFYDDKQGLEKTDLIDIANQINMQNKVVKVSASFRDGDWNVSAMIEAFLAATDTVPDTAIVKATLNRYLSALQSGVVAYVRAVQERMDAKTPGDNSEDEGSLDSI